MTPSELPFSEIWLHDFEFIAKPGCYPDVVCLAARELRSGQTLSLWLEPGERPPVPYRTDFDSLFVSFVASAELSCHLALGWPLPVKVLDLNPEFRCIMNGRPGAESRGLIGALDHFHIDNIGAKRKEAMQKRILQGRPYTREERELFLQYCMSDVDALERLLPKILRSSTSTSRSTAASLLLHPQ